MLAGLEREPLAKLVRDLQANRVGLGGLRHHFRDPERMEMLGHLPGRVGVSAREELHDREQMPEMLAVVAAAAAEDGALVGGGLELGFSQDSRNRRTIFRLEF